MDVEVQAADRGIGLAGCTGIGSMPGTDPRDAAAVVAGELPDLPHLVELPGRGPGADMIGRAGALLVDLHVDLQPSGWRLVDRPGMDERRAGGYLSHDLDAIEEALQGHGGLVKTQVAGPWTLSAALQLTRGEPVLSDPGAVRDVAASLAEAVASHVADLRRRIPAASIVVQLDEPSLPLVLAGRIRTMSGLGVVRRVAEHEAESLLRTVLAAAGVPVIVHCCAASPPVALLHRAGAAGVSLDAAVLRTDSHRNDTIEDEVGTALEAGMVLFAGVVASSGPALSDAATTVDPVRGLWRRLGLGSDSLATQVVVTPSCGLAGASPADARAALELSRRAAQVLVDDPEG